MIVIVGIVSIFVFPQEEAVIPQEEAVIQKQTQSIPELRVAFIGDQGLGPNAIAVLELIKDEGAQMVLHQGDFDYKNQPYNWDKQISGVLGSDFPYLATIGHHDVEAWTADNVSQYKRPVISQAGYQELLYDRLEKNPDVVCNGDLGIKSSCTYQGLFFILVAPGDYAEPRPDYDSFIKKQLNENDSNWRICSWHNDMNIIQAEAKPNETGWEVYESCKDGGAIIANAHMHFYARTKTLIDFENQIVDPEWSEPNKLRVKEGATFTFISGLGGMPIDKQMYDEWTVNYTSSQGATFGALFCTFNAGGQPNKAYCYFKNIVGNIIDEFTVTSFLGTYPDNTNLIGVDMSSRDLTGDDLSNTVITDANLSNAILIDADLSNAVLIGTTLTGADLTDANLTGVSLAYKDLTGTILRGADLTDANLTGVDLSDKDLTGTILRGADLTHAGLTGVDLSDKDLTGTILTGTNLTGAVLPNDYLSGKNFHGTIFNEVDLSGKDLSGSHFISASFKNTNLKNADLTDARLVEVDLTKLKSLVGANLSKAVISYSNLSGNDLDGATLGWNNMQHTNLSGLDFTVTTKKFMEAGLFIGSDLSNANLEGFVFIAKDELGNVMLYDAIIENGANLVDKSILELSAIYWAEGAYAVWVVTKEVVGNDLQLKVISMTDFGYANLQNANLSNTDLTNAVFNTTDLTNANLSNADLTYANLTNANLTGTNLVDANLTGAVLDGAILNCKNHAVCVPDT